MSLWKRARRELKRHFTVMLIPHNTVKPVRVSFSLSFILFMVCLWTGVTIWAGYISGRHIDYLRVKSDNELMNIKVKFFAQEVKKSQNYLEQVKENDQQVRDLLQMKNKKAIIEGDGKGGPTADDVKDLNMLLSGKTYEMNQQDMHRQAQALMQQVKARIDSYKEILDYVETQRALFLCTPNSWPCLGRITSSFGWRIHPIFTDNEFHNGLDIANVVNTPIYATAYGTVQLADWQAGYGRLIIIDHGNGYKSYFGHLHKFIVKAGDKVKRGQLIGLMGDSGSSTGTHVHYEIMVNGHDVNPAHYLKKVLAKNAT
jgi:murein DD-endopeptidase MepM/ murein hydrolase activator NlpD